MTVLITGGTGKTGLKIARLLNAAGYPVLLASRSGTAPEPFNGVKFDWKDPSTHANPFNKDKTIDRIYLVGPFVLDYLRHMKPFVDLAIAKGVNRFVLMSSSAYHQGSPAMGKVHQYIAQLGVEYCALRPSWFHENFWDTFGKEINNNNRIVSGAKDGLIPFIAADDIAEVAVKALTDEKISLEEPYIVGPQLFSYDAVADLLTEILGRKITHERLTDADMIEFWVEHGTDRDYAAQLTSLERYIAEGGEERVFLHGQGKIVGKRRLRDYLEANQGLWAQKSV